MMISSLPRVIVLAAAVCSSVVHGSDRDLSRQKRYLDLPKGSSFVVTIAMTTFLPKDILPAKIPNGLGHIIEYDFGYPFPGLAGLRKKPSKKPQNKKKKIKPLMFPETVYQPWTSEYFIEEANKRKWRKLVRRGKHLEDLSQFISRQGYDGTACIYRLSCEAAKHMTYGKSLLDDIALALLPEVPQAQCRQSYSECGFSPLHVLMHSIPIEEALVKEGLFQ